jgi:hypothetical protein
MQHYQWKLAIEYLDKVVENLGGSIHDTRCGKNWDPGQAMCAEAYGPDWMNNKTFIKWNNKDDDEPPEPHYLECAKRMAEGYIPDWVERE